MELSDKIKHILASKNLSPSIFADEIGVQRSSISHILAGRNKPSLDIVQKIIRRFPDLGLNWILDDEDLPFDIPEPTPSKPAAYTPEIEEKAPEKAPQISMNPTPVQDESIQENVSASKNSLPSGSAAGLGTKAVERIMIFYSDGTFQDFTPDFKA
ncbi:DNA-binding XRE family transcriptional regulator [Dyadobacter jejuensis]|uniref:DNA-binding XRE family transcriptional regulator n=1 Tax=Dyadobacter jejuensis TaxID=1082580 RepID=A0A316ANQ5_9BACT|nr:helix-turn-helix transcriptional regulator [Dyadobacter jejuensis]PWJ58949.1 DNA-binding XRE family transcriptional regulator [Dyadobacter jejuensis]